MKTAAPKHALGGTGQERPAALRGGQESQEVTMMRLIASILMATMLAGCSAIHYERTSPGELKGKLLVQWIGPDKFIFVPDKENPLTFKRHNNDQITPGTMYTDGGSIPRPLWAFRGYSPWGYAPAFIIHDWLFEMHHCQLPGHEKYSVDEAAWIMSEIMKTMMERYGVDKFTLYTMFEAVNSPVAANLWENGKCTEPRMFALGFEPKAQYVIEFP
jgi:hypothetical protein